nr:heavy metal translocating P-type ATPase [Verticiella sp. GG226]
MDLPAALGIVLAFVASSEATFSGQGHVWFDSVTMFVFFLLLARWLEGKARARATARLETLGRALPATVSRRTARGDFATVPVGQLAVGDVLRVPAGEAFAADGVVLAGDTQASEALLTGESLPVAKPCGAAVRAGSVNLQNPVLVRVERVGADATLGQIRQLVDQAAAARPGWMRAADHWATAFLVGVLVLAGVAWLAWQVVDPTRALSVAIAVLIVTCPCALSLATPAAMLSATAALARHGIWLRSPDALERLARVDHVAFDKTGTLTRGEPTLVHVDCLRAGISAAEACLLAAGLAQWSSHPASRAITRAAPSAASADDVQEIAGSGLLGTIAGRTCRLGNAAFAAPLGPDATPRAGTWLADEEGPIARFVIDDPLRADAPGAVHALQAAGMTVALLSGDAPARVARLAARLPLAEARGGMTPQAKLDRVRDWQRAGSTVAMVGDGINDGPALAGADISVTLGEASQLAQAQAAVVLASGRLDDIGHARAMAIRAVTVMRQNLTWAMGYNAACVPLAALGFMPPWAAGLGMALSSMLVIGNGMRLMRDPDGA